MDHVRPLAPAFALFLLAACAKYSAASSEQGTITPTPATSISRTAESSKFCDEFSNVGDILTSVKKGTETADEMVADLGDFQAKIERASADESGDAAKSLSKAADALGRLKVSVSSAGNRYPSDRVVIVRRQSASLTLFTAALANHCPT